MAPPPGKLVLVPLCVAASLFGFYATVIGLMSNGLGDIINSVVAGDAVALIGAPEPFKRVYTGIKPIDGQLSVLVAFFSALVDGDVKPEYRLYCAWGMSQFAAGWTLLWLEALRSGNRGRIVSWIGAIGLVFQNASWTFTLPLYLALHLVTSPVAKIPNGDGRAARNVLFVYLWDMALLPMSVTLAFLVPTVLMTMPPTLSKQSVATHYNLLAFWQFFPIWSVAIHGTLHVICYYALGSLSPVDNDGNKTSQMGKAYMTAVAGVYQFCWTVMMSVHLPLLVLCFAPASLRSLLISFFPRYASYIERATFANIFVPYSPFAPPTAIPTAYASGDLATLAVHFLHYDFYVASVPFLLWAIYLHQTTVKKPTSLVVVLAKVVFWAAVGGPHASVVALLWDRDQVVLEDDKPEEKKTQ